MSLAECFLSAANKNIGVPRVESLVINISPVVPTFLPTYLPIFICIPSAIFKVSPKTTPVNMNNNLQ